MIELEKQALFDKVRLHCEGKLKLELNGDTIQDMLTNALLRKSEDDKSVIYTLSVSENLTPSDVKVKVCIRKVDRAISVDPIRVVEIQLPDEKKTIFTVLMKIIIMT